MITYLAIEAIEPFFKEGEQLTLGEWMNRLNLDEPIFMRMVTACGGKQYFVECDSQIKVDVDKNLFCDSKGRDAKHKTLTISRKNMNLSDGEVKFLLQAIERILKPFNK